MITILILISRPQFLDKIFALLELTDCNQRTTNILGIVDGDNELFVTARNKIESSKFSKRLCIPYLSKDKMKNYDMAHRRQRIADLHNFAKQYIQPNGYVWGLEDDTTFSTNTLKKLQSGYNIYPFAGFIQGYQVGRHGINHYGIWKTDDVYNPQKLTSQLKPEVGFKYEPSTAHLISCDAGGLFCFMTRSDTYLKHTFKPFHNGDLGPDVDFGLALRKQGLMNYTDFTIPCDHHTPKGVIPANSEVMQIQFVKSGERFRQKSL